MEVNEWESFNATDDTEVLEYWEKDSLGGWTDHWGGYNSFSKPTRWAVGATDD